MLRDEADAGFRMWYMALANGVRAEQMLCYAESDDGVEWRKPLFDIVPYGEHEKTNILLGPEVNIHGPCVLRHPRAAEEQERYLVFFDSYSHYRPELPEVQKTFRWTYTATSPDGIRWSPRKGRPALAGKSDTGQSIVWDPASQRFIAYMRGVLSDDGTRVRYVRAATSPDFLHWENEVELLRHPDHRKQLHQFSATRYADLFIGLLSTFHVTDVYSTDEYPIFEEGTCDSRLLVSRDGMRWQPVAGDAAFLPLGEEGTWDARWITTASQLVFHDDRIWIYYSGSGRTRAQRHDLCLGLAQLPRDRFVALVPQNSGEEGVVELRPRRYGAGDLLLNGNAAEGEIRVELRTFVGEPLEGFGREDCVPMRADSLDHAVRWKGGGLTEAVATHRTPVRIHIRLRNARLHALRFAET